MNMNRTNSSSRREDALFVLALLVPAIVAGVRFNQSSHETAEMIARQSTPIQVVQTSVPTPNRRG
jgi:hypothetical protein